MRKLTVAALAAVTLVAALVAAPAHADPSGECRLDALTRWQGPQTSRNAFLSALVTGSPGENIAVVCEVRVDGVSVAAENGFGNTVVAVGQPVFFTADQHAVIEVCTFLVGNNGTTANCDGSPPQWGLGPLGYVHITATQGVGPTFLATGALADPQLFTCYDNAPATPYQVTCDATPGGQLFAWYCAVLHADVHTTSPSGVARTALDCDGGGPDAVTDVVSGITGWDTDAGPADLELTAFVCTVDAGAGIAATKDYTAGCGDPGARYE